MKIQFVNIERAAATFVIILDNESRIQLTIGEGQELFFEEDTVGVRYY